MSRLPNKSFQPGTTAPPKEENAQAPQPDVLGPETDEFYEGVFQRFNGADIATFTEQDLLELANSKRPEMFTRIYGRITTREEILRDKLGDENS